MFPLGSVAWGSYLATTDLATAADLAVAMAQDIADARGWSSGYEELAETLIDQVELASDAAGEGADGFWWRLSVVWETASDNFDTPPGWEKMTALWRAQYDVALDPGKPSTLDVLLDTAAASAQDVRDALTWAGERTEDVTDPGGPLLLLAGLAVAALLLLKVR